jgi:phosphoglycerate dehydrogenase-like enzyme
MAERVVAIGWHASTSEVEKIRHHLPTEWNVRTPGPPGDVAQYVTSIGDLSEVCADADMLLAYVLPSRVIERAARLRFVSWMHHGCDRLPLEFLKQRGIRVSNMAGEGSGAHDVAVAEHAMALLLACAKQIIAKDTGTKEARWDPIWETGYTISEINGKTLVVIGYGGIGQRVAHLAKAFGMRVIAVRRREALHTPPADETYGVANIVSALAQADFVVLALPLTHETLNLIEETNLAALPETSYVINVARADLIEEVALYRALVDGRIAGYASDVWWDDHLAQPLGYFPVPSRLGIHRLTNVIGAGDQGANTIEARDRTIELAARNAGAFARGERPSHVVDLDLGY